MGNNLDLFSDIFRYVIAQLILLPNTYTIQCLLLQITFYITETGSFGL